MTKKMKDVVKDRKSMMIYRTIYDSIRECEDKMRLSLYDAIFAYGFEFKDSNLSGVTGSLWQLIKPAIQVNWKRYLNKVGLSYDELISQSDALSNEHQNDIKTLSNEHQSVSVDSGLIQHDACLQNSRITELTEITELSDISIGKKRQTFIPPKIEEIKSFIAEKGYQLVDAELFHSHYESVGWMIGKNKMKDWKKAITSWELRNKKNPVKNSCYSDMNTGIILRDDKDKFKNEKEDW